MPPVIDQKKCIGCGICADICPTQVFLFNMKKDKTPRIAFPDECWYCNSCVLDCKQKAVFLEIPMQYMLLHVDANTLKP